MHLPLHGVVQICMWQQPCNVLSRSWLPTNSLLLLVLIGYSPCLSAPVEWGRWGRRRRRRRRRDIIRRPPPAGWARRAGITRRNRGPLGSNRTQITRVRQLDSKAMRLCHYSKERDKRDNTTESLCFSRHLNRSSFIHEKWQSVFCIIAKLMGGCTSEVIGSSY